MRLGMKMVRCVFLIVRRIYGLTLRKACKRDAEEDELEFIRADLGDFYGFQTGFDQFHISTHPTALVFSLIVAKFFGVSLITFQMILPNMLKRVLSHHCR